PQRPPPPPATSNRPNPPSLVFLPRCYGGGARVSERRGRRCFHVTTPASTSHPHPDPLPRRGEGFMPACSHPESSPICRLPPCAGSRAYCRNAALCCRSAASLPP